MKRIITAAVLGAVLISARIECAQAYDGCVAGAVVGGIFAGAVIASVLQPHTVYYTAPAYYAPPAPVYYQPASVVYATPAPAVVCARETTVVYAEPRVVRFGFDYVRPRHHRHGW